MHTSESPLDHNSSSMCRLLGKLRSYTLEGRGVEESLSLSIAVPRGFPQAHVQQVRFLLLCTLIYHFASENGLWREGR